MDSIYDTILFNKHKLQPNGEFGNDGQSGSSGEGITTQN